MRNCTNLIDINCKFMFSEAGESWISKLQENKSEKVEFPFFEDHQNIFEESIQSKALHIIQSHFHPIPLSNGKIIVTASRKGSWLVDASLILFASMGTVYTLIKAVSDVPAILDGLGKLANMLSKGISIESSRQINDRIRPIVVTLGLPQPPSNLIYVDVTIEGTALSEPSGQTSDSKLKHMLLLSCLRALSEEGIEDPDIDLFLSVMEGDTVGVKNAIEAGANVSVTDVDIVRKYSKTLTSPGFSEKVALMVVLSLIGM